MYVQLITAELASATGKASFFAALESACVELYLVRTEADNPASVIFDTCEKHGRMRWLFEWVLEVIDPLDTCVNDEVSDNSKRQLLLADCVFELAGMLDYESRESNWIGQLLALQQSGHAMVNGGSVPIESSRPSIAQVGWIPQRQPKKASCCYIGTNRTEETTSRPLSKSKSTLMR